MTSQNAEPAFQVRLGEGGPRFAVPPGRTVLQAAEEAGLALPSSCRVGTCRACMQQLAEGCVRYRIEWPGLLPEEKAEGWILPCVACPVSDLGVCAADGI